MSEIMIDSPTFPRPAASDRELPICIQDFKTVIDEGYYFVDKSMLIEQVVDGAKNGVILYTRPRRFGKSLNLSMMDAFFNLSYRGSRRFDGLRISEHKKYESHMNAYPVINIDLRVPRTDYGMFLEAMRGIFSDLSRTFRYLADSDALDGKDKDTLRRMRDGELTDCECRYALKDLSRMLRDHHGTKTVILIDEYDCPMNSFRSSPDFGKVSDFVSDMLSFALKGNDSLRFGVLTGVSRIAEENIFGELNNLKTDNGLSDVMFGFTELEVRKMLSDFGCSDSFGECRTLYDGYRFGNAEVYNPWSVLNYIDCHCKPDTRP